MVGSSGFYISSVSEELKKAGIEVYFFNPVSPWRITNFTSNFFRTHKKILIIDGNICHIGGVNIRDDMRFWRDTNVRFTGELVEEARHIFARMIQIIIQKRFLPFKRPDVFIKNFAIRTNSPHFRQRFIYNEMIDMIRNAKDHIYLTTPYFVPDLRFFRVLRLAAKRGVDVRLLIPKTSNYLMVDLACQSYFTLLLKSGVKIHLYNHHLLHAKTAVIDDTWATVGSFNLDSLSFLFNYEVNVVSTDQEFAEGVKKQFFEDAKESLVVIPKDWYHRSFIQKILEGCSWPFHKFL